MWLKIPNLNAPYDRRQVSHDDQPLWDEDYRHLAQKGGLWRRPGRSVLMCHSFSDLATHSELRGAERILVPYKSFDLCADVMSDPQSLAALVSIARDEGRVTIDPWVATETVAQIADFLLSRGVKCSPAPDAIRKCAALAAGLQSRSRHCALLDRLCAPPLRRPGHRAYDDWEAVRRFLATDEGRRPSVIKSDASVGGNGIVFVDNDVTRGAIVGQSLEEFCASRPYYLRMSAPFVVEDLVGSLATNLSPTVDVVEAPTGPRAYVGEQVLYHGGVYGGVVTGMLPAPIVATVAQQAIMLWKALSAEGAIGQCNFDFVVDGAETWIAEINLRKSSPFDHFLEVECEPPQEGQISVSLDFAERDQVADMMQVATEYGISVHKRLSPSGSPTWTGIMLTGTAPAIADAAAIARLEVPSGLLDRLRRHR
jgi:hypothetical protein